MSIRAYCDNCEKEIIGEEAGKFMYMEKVSSLDPNASPLPQVGTFSYDLCRDCVEKLKKQLNARPLNRKNQVKPGAFKA